MYADTTDVVDLLPNVLALPSSDAFCPGWQPQSSLLAAVASTDKLHTSDSSDTIPAHPVVFTDDTLGIMEYNAAMQHAVLERAIASSAMPANKLPEPTIPAPYLERLPQEHGNFVFVDMVNTTTIALPLVPVIQQTHGTGYAFNKFQLREEQPLLDLQQLPMAAADSAFLTLDSIAALCSNCLTACAALFQSAWSHCGSAFRCGQSCSHFSMYLQQPHCSLSVYRLCTTCCSCCRDVVRMMRVPESTALLHGAIASGMVLPQMSFI